MEFQTKNVPLILSDNDRGYFLFLEAIVASIDVYAHIMVVRNPEDYFFRISPSEDSYIDPLIKELNSMHNMFGINVNFSKSIRTSHAISWKIPIFADK